MTSFRDRLRDAATVVLLALPLLGLLAFVWASRHPDDPRVESARGWPIVGRWLPTPVPLETPPGGESAAAVSVTVVNPGADEVRRSFTGLRVWFQPGTEIFSDPTADDADAVLELPTRLTVSYQSGSWVSVDGRHRGWTRFEGDPVERAELPSQHRTVWVRPGDPLRSEPGGEVLTEVATITNLPVTDTGPDDWVEVVHEDRKWWLEAPEFTGGPPPLGSATRPIRPLASLPITASRLRAARQEFSATEVEARSGPYNLVGDSPRVSAIATICAQRLSRVDGEFERVTGVHPLPLIRETILLFSERDAYLHFISAGPLMATDPDGYALPAEGFAASHIEPRSDEEVCDVVVHEAVHLTSRRAFGPALPPWLSEGLAGWLEGRDHFALEPSVATDIVLLDDEFYLRDTERRYAQATVLTRRLLQQPELAEEVRGFLRDRASGKPLEQGPGLTAADFWAALTERLGVSEDELWSRLLRRAAEA